MATVTLTTDLGTKDYYAAALKAALVSQIEGVQIVDITHEIAPFNIAKAAFVVRNVWRDFPKGTIHLIGVDTQWSETSPWVIVVNEGHYFIGADNGIFSLIFDDAGISEVYTIESNNTAAFGFPGKNIFVPAAAALANGSAPEALGQRRHGYRIRPALHPVVENDNIRGTVIYVDGYGNVITNIHRDLFEKTIGEKPFSLVLKRGDRDLNRICTAYNDVPEGEKVATFTSGGYLEIAINRGVEGSGGGASGLLGLRVDDVVRIEFDR